MNLENRKVRLWLLFPPIISYIILVVTFIIIRLLHPEGKINIIYLSIIICNIVWLGIVFWVVLWHDHKLRMKLMRIEFDKINKSFEDRKIIIEERKKLLDEYKRLLYERNERTIK